jgi:hypothetical protein
MDSLIVDTAIGLVFVFAVFSALVSVLTEGVARFVGLRGEYLLRGLRSMLDGKSTFQLSIKDLFLRRKTEAPQPVAGEPTNPLVTQLMANPLVSVTADKGNMPAKAGDAWLSNKDRRKLPSYLSGRTFARAVLATVVPDAAGATTMNQVETYVNMMEESTLRTGLISIVKSAGSEVEAFRNGIEEWYDDHMARVSGWYKRHTRWISLGIGALLVLSFNINAVEITRSLYTDQALRESVVTQAVGAAQCREPKTPAQCLQEVRQEIGDLRDSGLPIGWGTVTACAARACDGPERFGLTDPQRGLGHDLVFLITVVLGWLLMVIALLPGCRFWFDALSRLNSLRSTGPRPKT